MKKIISFVLIVVFTLNIVPLNCFAADETYKSINVEYSDNKGNNESLNVMIANDDVYVDAFQLGERLGYEVWLTKNKDGVVIYNNDNKNIPRLLAVFYFDSTTLEYLVLNRIMKYEAPFNSIYNKSGSWIPLKYAIYALNSSMLIIDDVVTVSTPKNTLLHTILSAAGKMEEIQFDYYSDMNFSDGTMFWKTGASRIVNLFSGILEFEGESWLLMFQQFWGDTSAYDNKFGDELATLFCTNSDKELEALNEEISLLTDIFSTDGKLATSLSEIKTDLDTNVGDLYKQCNELFKKIDESNSNVLKYNATYEKLESAFNKQTNFYNTGQVALDVQGGLDSVTKKLAVLGEIVEVTGYISEFSEKDTYSINALLNYLSEFNDDTILPESLTYTLKSNAELLNSNFAAYSVAKYIENNYSDWIQSGLKIGQQMGAQANLILLAWNIASATVPFIKNGLDSANNFEISTYAYALQQDSFANYVDYREDVFGNEDLINSENCYKISQYFYTYLKSAYITRDAAIGSFAEHKDKPESQDVIEMWAKPNDTIAKYLAEVKMVSKDNKDGSLGFLPDLSRWLVSNYNDSDLLRLLGYNISSSDIISDEIDVEDTPIRETSDERDIVLVLDTSGSMSGTPIEEVKKASTNFVSTILKEDASIGVVTYESSATMISDFSINENYLKNTVTGINSGGGTNIESGLLKAEEMLRSSNAKKKIIVLMSDGAPGSGKVGDELIAYADTIKNQDIYIYTLGFFESMGGSKSSAQILMEGIASDGCHYEVADADNLVFFFGDIADQINGQKYIYVRIACPVDVTVKYDGETLCSVEEKLNTRTAFGSLTFEDNEKEADSGSDNRIKVLRLKEGTDYDIQIEGNGRGYMDYTIGFMDDTGEYSDLRKFSNIKITKRTVIDTVATDSNSTVLNVDEDGDGKYDLKYRALENGRGEIVDYTYVIYIAIGVVVLILILIVTIKIKKYRKSKRT